MPRLILRDGRWYLAQRSAEVRLTEREAGWLLCLLFNGQLTLDDAVEIAWPDPDKQADWWRESLRKGLFDLNKKLQTFGLSVKARPGGAGIWEIVPAMDGRRQVGKQPRLWRTEGERRCDKRQIRKRNAEIVIERQRGIPRAEVAAKHRICESWVTAICREYQKAAQ